MRSFYYKFSNMTCLSITTLLFLSTFSSTFADDTVKLITDLSPIAECEEKDQIIPTCIFSRPTPTNAVELISGDLKVCKCLEKNNQLFSQYEDQPSTQIKSQSERDRLIEIEGKKAANGGIVQSTSYAKDRRALETSLLVYGGQETRRNKKLETVDGSLRNTTQSVQALLTSTNITKINQIDSQNREWQCVTFQEYSVQREIPTDNAFFQILKNSEFSPADWNVNQLRSKYDTAPEPEKESIRIKLTFLSRNPIFQSIMKADPTAVNTAAKILAKQTELFSILKTLSPSQASTCFSVPNGCFQEIHTSGAFGIYTSKVGDFLLDKDVIRIASAQAANDYQTELAKISSQGDLVLNSIPTDPEGYFNYLQNANRELASSCAGETAQASCYTKFSQHCTHLRAVDERVKLGIRLTGQDLISGLREETSLHLSLDPATNPSFRSFNDKICLQPHTNAAGESLNFFQYQSQKCSASASLPECSDRKALLRKFLSEHNGGLDVADANLRTGFSRILDNTSFIDVSLAQVEAANNVSESPDELLARFGGEFPSISPQGTLIPAVQSLVPRTASASASSSSSSISNDVVDSDPQTASQSGATSRVSPTFGSADLSQNSSANSAVRNRETFGSTSNLIPDAIDLPERNRSPIYVPPVALRRGPASINENQLDENESTSEPLQVNAAPIQQPRPAPSIRAASGGGIVSGGSAATVVDGGGGELSPDSIVRINGIPQKKKPTSKGLLFKYGLDGNNQPEITLVSSATSEEVKVGVDRNLMDRIKSNPNALEIGQADMDKILATPDDEVKLVLESTNGSERLVVYAKKDDSGGISFSLKPNSSPATSKNAVRINVLPDVYNNIAADPDVHLNQNSTLIDEIESKPGSLPILQIVSPGKKALIYEVTKTDDFIYHFKLKNK